MSRNGGGGNGIFFQRTVLLMSLSLILLFAAYELLETPKGFLVIKIIGFKQEDNGFSLVLFIRNNSSEKHEGRLIFLIGYGGSRVSENTTLYCFTGFKTLNFSIITLNPGESRRLDVKLPPDPGAERIIVAYCYDPGSIVQTGYHSPVLLRRNNTVWVQTWIG
ncbi:MAG: hypothetical protein FGF53_01335 [Candidatus Brockarchaeota archaeon]|nr:hypothetical protein [Candidatus Brockarchaeota archaeon]